MHKEKLIEGWIEGPIAEAADLRGINNLMMDFFDDPGFVTELFEFVLELELTFAKAQVASGAELIGVGDAAASLVGPKIYQEFVWPYEKRMMDGLRAMGARTRLHICGNTRPILGLLGKLGCDIVDLDSLAPAGRGARGDGAATGAAGEYRSRAGAAQRNAGRGLRRRRRMPPAGRRPIHCERRLRSGARYSPGKPARHAALRAGSRGGKSDMNSRDRVFAMLDGRPVDCLPVMPITMMFAADQIGAKYFAYGTDYHVLAEAQIRTAEEFDFDHVSAIAETREAPDCGAVVEYFEDQPASIVEAQALLADKKILRN